MSGRQTKSDVKTFFEKTGVHDGRVHHVQPAISQLIVANTADNLETFEAISAYNAPTRLKLRPAQVDQTDLEELGSGTDSE